MLAVSAFGHGRFVARPSMLLARLAARSCRVWLSVANSAAAPRAAASCAAALPARCTAGASADQVLAASISRVSPLLVIFANATPNAAASLAIVLELLPTPLTPYSNSPSWRRMRSAIRVAVCAAPLRSPLRTDSASMVLINGSSLRRVSTPAAVASNTTSRRLRIRSALVDADRQASTSAVISDATSARCG